MNCREFEADVVDLARGVKMDAVAETRLATHLERCAGCAARFARERQMTTALTAVAVSIAPSPRAAAIEEQLLRAFAERRAAPPSKAPAPRSRVTALAARASLAAAAVLVLAVAVWQGAARWRSVDSSQSASAQTAASPVASAPVVPPAGLPAQGRGDAPTGTPVEVTPPPAAPLAPIGPRAIEPRTAPFGEDEVLRFVSLPTAVGLPALESGHIVRVELQTAMLSAYGLDVAPDAAAGFVEADVLVGQDGQPRAIRFVNLNQDSRRRQ